MEAVKVVLRYADGRVVKGVTQDFFPNKDRFHLHVAPKTSGEPVEVLVKEKGKKGNRKCYYRHFFNNLRNSDEEWCGAFYTYPEGKFLIVTHWMPMPKPPKDGRDD